MAYIIELLSVGDDFSPLLEAAAKQLNGLQEEFDYRVVSTSSPMGADGIAFQRVNYLTTQLFEWLAVRRQHHGGRRDGIICFVNRPLDSAQLANIFGSHRGKDGMAVVTLRNSEQYVHAQVRFCIYFLVRYALSFVNPSVRSHDDPERKACYFSRKMFKPEIQLSLESGLICDHCSAALQQPYGPSGRTPSAAEWGALAVMRKEVSGDLPRAIVMKGGGVKGLAFAGALLELESYYWFDQHVGTSAGAIAAVLLAANYTPSELRDELRKTRFSEFKDASWWKVPINLIVRRGMYPGERFRLWIAGLLQRKLSKQSEVRMDDLNGAVIYACRPGPGTLTFDSTGDLRGTVASFAVRCSMSIPIFFTPERHAGRRVFDGGMLNNFPLASFLASNPGKPYVGLYLGWSDNTNRGSMLKDLYEIFIDGEERTLVDENRDSIVVIDPRPISTVDFDLTDTEQEFLIAEGRACALEFLSDRKFDNGPEAELVVRARTEANALRDEVTRLRQRKSILRKRIVLAVLFPVGGYLLCWFL